MPQHRPRPSHVPPLLRLLPGAAALTALITVSAVVPGGGAWDSGTTPLDRTEIVPAAQEVQPEIESVRVPAVRQMTRRMAKAPSAAPSAGSSPGEHDHADADADAPQLHPVARLTQKATDEYSMLGVTWEPAAEAMEVRVEVRTRNDQGWSDWEELHVDADHGPVGRDPDLRDPDLREGTAPQWVDKSDGIQVQVLSDDPKGPEDIQVELIDPGETTGTQLMSGTTHLTAKPRIITRRQWGADESMSGGCWEPITADTVKAVFVHHTVNSNDYTKAQSAGLVRGAYAYHTRSQGWCDIGYNFLVDRYGQIFEGRDGGIRRPVRGAHAGDVNTGSTGISLIGNFQNARPTSAMKNALEHLVAWQLESRYRDPQGTTILAGDRYAVISGHRDAMSTACPGRYVYEWLPTLRNRVEARIGNWRSAIYQKWQRLGGESGWVRSPYEGEKRQDGGRNTIFNNATIFYKGGLGAHEVNGAIRNRYRAIGEGGSALGFPRTDTHTAGGQENAQRVSFEHGRIYRSDRTGAHEVVGPVMKAYARAGGAAGELGFPVDGTRKAGRAEGTLRSSFQNGRIYWSKSTGGHEVLGRVMDTYARVGGAAGVLGFPVDGTHRAGRQKGALRSSFQHGRIYWSQATGGHEVHGMLMRAYAYHGGAAGWLGFPTTDVHRAGRQAGAERVNFQHGRIYWSRATGMREVHGPIMTAYGNAGGAAGRLGFPTTGVRDVRGGERSDFQHGWIRWDRSSNKTAVHYD